MIPALLAVAAGLSQAVQLVTPWRFRALFVEVARAQGGNENLLHALAWHESGLDPTAVGATNENGTRDYGLMQINERNFAALGLTPVSVFDPAANVRAAQQLLTEIGRTPGRTLTDVISIYNAGTDQHAPTAGQPRKLPSGAYINQAYVDDVLMKYRQVALAAFAPWTGGTP